MKNKIPFGLIILAVAIGGSVVTRFGHDTFQWVYSIIGILIITLSYYFLSKKRA